MKYGYAALTMIALCATALAQQNEKPYVQEQDKVYAEVHGVGLLMDVFTPTGAKNGLAVVDIASGAWHSDRGKIRDHEAAKTYDNLCKHGYVVFAIRPGSRTGFTVLQMVDHVKLGIRYAKAHAAEYGIDPAKIGLMGASAGGHLAMMTVLTAEDGDPNAKQELRRFDTRVAAVCAFFPPTDFLDWGGKPANFERLGDLLFHGGVTGRSPEEIEAEARRISPALLVQSGLPPILLVHGDADETVPLQQSEKLLAALTGKGNQAELIVKKGGGHPWLTIFEEIAMMADWFDKQLGVAKAE